MAPVVPTPVEQHLRGRLRELATAHPRYGYRRLRALLVREGYMVNHKRVARLCREEGLRVRVKKRKRSRVGTSTVAGDRLRADHPNHVWALDFAFDQTSDCRTLKYLNVTDEFTRTALAIDVERSITGDDMVMVLERLTAVHGFPQFVRMDNGTEMTSNAIADWCRFKPSGIVFIDPGTGDRTRSPNRSTAGSATNCWPSNSSTPSSRPRSWPRTTASSTTSTGHTPRWAT